VPPGLRVGATIDLMGTPVRAGADIFIERVSITPDELRFEIRLDKVSLKVADDAPESPIAALLRSGALDLSKPGNLAAYINAAGIDVKLPLVADYNGAMINVSIRSVDDMKMSVDFFAPVFAGILYRFANPVEDYIQSFGQQLAGMKDAPVTLSCNCILNYLYAELEGKQTGRITGPITFGEIAYMLLNQTLVYLAIE